MKTLLLAFFTFLATPASSTAPAVDSDGCSSFAYFDAVSGDWEISCTGSTCGDPADCEILAGGSGAFTFEFCGCEGGEPPTPKCCYIAVDSTGPFGNGLCKDMGAPAGAGCPRGTACDAHFQAGGQAVGKCKFILPPPPWQ